LKLHLATVGTRNTFTGYGAGFVMINGTRHDASLIVLPEALVTDWGATTFESLALPHMERLAQLDAEVVLLGTGARFAMPAIPLMQAVRGRGIGLEVMDTQAACRTYNILLAEDRKVAAAILL